MSLCIDENLRLMRNKHGYTLESLAEIVAVSRQTIAKWESGESYPDIENCVKLARLYKISLDELVNKPLWAAEVNDLSGGEHKVCGVLEVSEGGSITLPKKIMDMFSIKPGEKILILADKKQGIAIVKCSQF